MHLEVENPAHAQTVLRDTRQMLKEKYSVRECTVQIEHFTGDRKDCGQCDVPAKWIRPLESIGDFFYLLSTYCFTAYQVDLKFYWRIDILLNAPNKYIEAEE